MRRRRTSRAKKKRSRRMKGGMKSASPLDAAGGGGGGASGGHRQINVLALERYLSQLNEYIIHLLKNANMLVEGSSGYYSYDLDTPGTTSRQLYNDLKIAFGKTPDPPTRNLIEAKQDIELMLKSIRTGGDTPGLRLRLRPLKTLTEAEAKRLAS